MILIEKKYIIKVASFCEGMFGITRINESMPLRPAEAGLSPLEVFFNGGEACFQALVSGECSLVCQRPAEERVALVNQLARPIWPI